MRNRDINESLLRGITRFMYTYRLSPFDNSFVLFLTLRQTTKKSVHTMLNAYVKKMNWIRFYLCALQFMFTIAF